MINNMLYTRKYISPIGEMTLSSDGYSLTGLWFTGQKYYPDNLPENDHDIRLFDETFQWLDAYFSGRKPDFDIPVSFSGTEFQIMVWNMLLEIPYGKTVSYGDVSEMLRNKYGHQTSARAVGTAVGHNPISIIVPCHRVIGFDGSLTGYAGGLERKIFLLDLEKNDPLK